MSFEFEYEAPDRAASRRTEDGKGSGRGPLIPPRWIAAIVVVLILVASTVITSRNRDPEREIDAAAPSSPPTDTRPASTTAQSTLPRPPTTRLVPVESGRPADTTLAVAPDPPDTKVDWGELALSVVYVEAGECPSFPADIYSSGSGTVVLGGTHVLTNAHVVLDDNGRPCHDLVAWFTGSFEE